MSRCGRGIVTAGALAVLAFGVSPVTAAVLDHTVLCDPKQDFNSSLTNAYAGMQAGQVSTYFGMDGKVPLGLQIKVETETEDFYTSSSDDIPTLTTAIVVETEWADKDADGVIDPKEKLIEVSHNYFAQTDSGTVCYFGEDVKIFNKGGKFKGDTSGSWRADEHGNAPGIFMPADPKVGDAFQMESAPDIAEDEAEVLQVELRKTVPAGEFNDVIEVKDCNPLEEGPDNCGIKYYAAGQGLIVDGPVELRSTP